MKAASIFDDGNRDSVMGGHCDDFVDGGSDCDDQWRAHEAMQRDNSGE